MPSAGRVLAKAEQNAAGDQDRHRTGEIDRDLSDRPDRSQNDEDPLDRHAAYHEEADEDAGDREQEKEAAADQPELLWRNPKLLHHRHCRKPEDELVEKVQRLEQKQKGKNGKGAPFA